MVVFTALHPLALFASLVYANLYRRQGVALLLEDDALHRSRVGEGRAQEVDPEQVWPSR